MSQQTDSKTALQDTLEMLDNIAAYKAHMQKEEEKRQVNIRLPSTEFDLLEQLSEHFDESRTSMAQHLLQAAIHDACHLAGIEHDVYDAKGNKRNPASAAL